MCFFLQAWELYQQGRLLDIVDASMGSYPEKEVLRYIKVGLACTQATPSSRPTMRQVLDLLSRPVALPETEMCPPSFAEHPCNNLKIYTSKIPTTKFFLELPCNDECDV